jgi:hypothetical protein
MSEHAIDQALQGGTMLYTPQRFGAWIRRRRMTLGLKLEELALLIDVGPRFVCELEAGKPTCQIGKALAVARALGGKLADAAEADDGPPPATAPSTPPRPRPHDPRP